MTTITLSEIKAAQDRVAALIAQYEAEAAAASVAKTVLYVVPEAQIELQPGEVYVGLILGSDEEPSYHLILLPGQATDVTWEDAKAWAAKAGGELPTRREQRMLIANAKQHFEEEWYWSSEQYSARRAWIQFFYDGSQSSSVKSAELRARAVRRFNA